MKGNRLLLLDKELNTYKKKPAKLAKGKSLYSIARSDDKKESKVSETIVDDDVFVIEILEYFFGKKLSENQLTNELREIVAKCFWT
jgi:hypothetical protein